MIVLTNAGTFLLFAGFNFISVVFLLLFMKETKGLTDAEVKVLYRKDRDIIGEFESKLKTEGQKDDDN
jgi:hypothetical protein